MRFKGRENSDDDHEKSFIRKATILLIVSKKCDQSFHYISLFPVWYAEDSNKERRSDCNLTGRAIGWYLFLLYISPDFRVKLTAFYNGSSSQIYFRNRLCYLFPNSTNKNKNYIVYNWALLRATRDLEKNTARYSPSSYFCVQGIDRRHIGIKKYFFEVYK